MIYDRNIRHVITGVVWQSAISGSECKVGDCHIAVTPRHDVRRVRINAMGVNPSLRNNYWIAMGLIPIAVD